MTNIEWTDVTDNIITVAGGGWWCQKISPGCANCYAANLNQNTFFGGNKLPYSGKPPTLELKENILTGWAQQRKPKKHFVASMTDVFGEWVPRAWQLKMLSAMTSAYKQTFQVLTKRPDIMLDACDEWMSQQVVVAPPTNIWLGTSIENQAVWESRSEALYKLHNRNWRTFYSCEPLLGELELYLHHRPVHWVIVGGESGANARPCEIAWVRSLMEQCQLSEIPVFVKQLGTAWAHQNPTASAAKDKKGGNWDLWEENLKVREFPFAV